MISDSHAVNPELEPARIETGERPVRHLTVVGVGGTALDSVQSAEEEDQAQADAFTTIDPENDLLTSAIGEREVDQSLENTVATVKVTSVAKPDMLEALKQKEEAAARELDFDTLYHLTHQKINRLLVAMLGREDAAEEVKQETFLRVWKGLSSFRGESGVYTWITGIAMNEVARYSRRKRHRYESSEEVDLKKLQEPDPSAIQALTDVDTAVSVRRRLADAFLQLSPTLRDTVMLRYVEGLSVGEAAVVLDTSEGNVKVRTSRGSSQLRELLKDLDPSTLVRDANTEFRTGSTRSIGTRVVALSSDILDRLDGVEEEDAGILREAVSCFRAGMGTTDVARHMGINQTILRRKLGGIIQDLERERLPA